MNEYNTANMPLAIRTNNARRRSVVVSRRTLNLRSLYSVIIALLPAIMVFKVPLINKGASTVLLGLFMPYALMESNGKKRTLSMLPLLLFIGYCMVRSVGDPQNLFLLFVVFVHVYGAMYGSIDVRIAVKTLETVAVICTACVVFQTLMYYVFGVRFMFLTPGMILDANRNIFFKLSGMYRPSAFFLEPSHYAQYASFPLMTTLFPLTKQKAKLGKAIWIALGCLLTTSGMGIALCVGILLWYALFTQRKKGTKLLYLLIWISIGVVAFVVLMQFSFFRLAVQRVFDEVDGYNAIRGRTLYWGSHIGSMSGATSIIGYGSSMQRRGYLTGLMAVLYNYGYIGLGLFLIVLLYLFIKGRSLLSRCACVVYCALMCIANLFSFISLSFWICMIVSLSNPRKCAESLIGS